MKAIALILFGPLFLMLAAMRGENERRRWYERRLRVEAGDLSAFIQEEWERSNKETEAEMVRFAERAALLIAEIAAAQKGH